MVALAGADGGVAHPLKQVALGGDLTKAPSVPQVATKSVRPLSAASLNPDLQVRFTAWPTCALTEVVEEALLTVELGLMASARLQVDTVEDGVTVNSNAHPASYLQQREAFSSWT